MKTKYYTASELGISLLAALPVLTVALCCAGGVWKWLSWCFG